MTSFFRNSTEDSRSFSTRIGLSPPPQIAYPAPTSQPNATRIFFIPGYIIGGSSRRPRQSASVPQLMRAQADPAPNNQENHAQVAGSTGYNDTEMISRSSSDQSCVPSTSRAFASSHSQSGKFKLKIPYSSARQRLNKFINKNLIPSFFYNSDAPSPSSPSPSSSSSSTKRKNNPYIKSESEVNKRSHSQESQNPTAPQEFQQSQLSRVAGSTSDQRPGRVVTPSYSTPNLHLFSLTPPVLNVPPETASISSLRASRSRQGSVSTTYTVNDTSAGTINSLNAVDGYLGVPGSTANDSSSLYGLPMLDRLPSHNSFNSSLSSTSNYYAQQYQLQQHLQHQAKHTHALLDDSESGVGFLSEDIQGPFKDLSKVDFVRLFPREIVDQIFSSLDTKSLLVCSLVCKCWKSVANANAVWRSKFFQTPYWDTVNGHLPYSNIGEKQLTWKFVYETRHKLEERWKSGRVEPKALKGHSDSVYCVHYNEDIIVTGSRDQTIKVWDARSGALLKTLGGSVPEPIEEVVENRAVVQLPEPNEATVTENSTPTFRSTTAFLTPMAASSSTDAATTVASTSDNNSDQIKHNKSVLCLHFDQSLMVSGSSDSSIILWSLPKFTPFKKIQQHSAGVLDVVVGANYVCSCSRDSTICVWERPLPLPNGEYDPTSEVVLKRVFKGHRGPVNSVQMRDDLIFSAGGDALVKMWSISSGTCVKDFAGHFRGLACIQLSPDGKTIVSGSNDKQIRVWDVESSRCLHVLEGHTALVRSLDLSSGKIISGSYDQTIKIWDLQTGLLISDLDSYFGSWIFSAKADCKRIICTSFGSKPVILDYSSGLDRRCLDFLAS